MEPFEIAAAVIGWANEYMEKQKEDQARKDLANKIISACHQLQQHIEDIIESLALAEAKGDLKAFSQELETKMREHDESIYYGNDNNDREEQIKALRKSFEELTDNLRPLIYTLENYAKVEDVTLATGAYTIYCDAIALAITVFSQRATRFDYYLAYEEIVKLLNSNMETSFSVEKYLFLNPVAHPQAPSMIVNITHPYHPQQKDFKNIQKYRMETEQNRYLYLKNLNSKFLFNVNDEKTEFGGYSIKCTNRALKDDNGRQVLAVNNKDGTENNPNFYKRVSGLYPNTTMTFRVNAKTLNPSREVELAIIETDQISNTVVNEKRERFTLQNSWIELNISIDKKQDNSVLDFVVFWFDNDESDMLVSKASIDFSKREYKLPLETLPMLHPIAWERSRCSHINLMHVLSDEHMETQYIKANDAAGTHGDPSISQHLYIWPNSIRKYKVIFEAFVKTNEDIGREVNVVVWDLKKNYPGGSGPVSYGTGRIRISNIWQKLRIECEIIPSINVKCEIYWFDNKEDHLYIKDAIFIYHVVQE
ncbi:hypothetical protein [Peribacillus sp. YIM B13477]|uniref:hypothetical protein n=1 Tax=Peribacillus sp. YIM B13477 TaxID=3366300 RepID=UPI003670713F